jgi:hypothetical protein
LKAILVAQGYPAVILPGYKPNTNKPFHAAIIVPYQHSGDGGNFLATGFVFLDIGRHLPLGMLYRKPQLSKTEPETCVFSFAALKLAQKYLQLNEQPNGDLIFYDCALNHKFGRAPPTNYKCTPMSEEQLRDCALDGVTTEREPKILFYDEDGAKVLGFEFKNSQKTLQLRISWK